MGKENPFDFLEESLRSLKGLIGGAGDNPFFDAEFVSKLAAELKNVQHFCEQLDKDPEFVRNINLLTDPDGKNAHYYKAAHFFLSDVIAIYEKLSSKAAERSLFVLASYYDVLRNGHFPVPGHSSDFNRLVADPAFKTRIADIRAQHRLPNSEGAEYFLPGVLKKENVEQVLNYYAHFVEAGFGLKFKGPAEAQSFFAITREVKSAKHSLANDTLEKVLAELDVLTGLEKVKTDLRELINVLEVRKKREKEGLKNPELALHTVFFGPPGTGKTSVARLLSRVFFHLGFLTKGHCVETDREGLIAGYVGQTATKVDKLVVESLGGVLFIDEAYSLTQSVGTSDYGAEAVNTLLKRMEDHRDDLAVVVAGYTEPMKLFLESNPGLRSRFSRYFFFDHFSPSELLAIFRTFCKQSDFVLSEEAEEKLLITFELLYDKRDEGFGNARVVRNLFERCTQNQANRIIRRKSFTKKVLKTLEEQDIPEPKSTVESVYITSEEK